MDQLLRPLSSLLSLCPPSYPSVLLLIPPPLSAPSTLLVSYVSVQGKLGLGVGARLPLAVAVPGDDAVALQQVDLVEHLQGGHEERAQAVAVAADGLYRGRHPPLNAHG